MPTKFQIKSLLSQCFACCMLLLGITLSRATPVVPDSAPAVVLDAGQLQFLKDTSRTMALDDAKAAFAQGHFKPLVGNLGLGYVPDAVWLHLTISQDQPVTRWLEVMPPYLDDIRLFHIAPDGPRRERRAGDRVPQSAKEEPYRGHLFKLDLPPGQHEVFIRLQTTSTMAAIVKLWQPRAFEQHLRYTYFAYGLYFSLILTVLLFNAANWLVSRRVIFLVYISYLLIISLQWLATNGFVSEFLLPERPDLANLALGLSISLGAGMAWLFFMLILELKQYHPYLYRFSQLGIAVSLATFVATLTGHYQAFAPVLLLTGIASLLTTPWPIWRLWKTGEIWARMLALAYFLYALLVLMNVLGTLAVLPFTEWNIGAGMMSNIVHILFLHFAILLHFRRVETDHAIAVEKSALAEKQLQIEQAYRNEQDQLLRMMSHEIRTPIALIDSARQVLEALDEDQHGPPEPERQMRYRTIQRAVGRLGALTDMALTREKDIPQAWQLVNEPIDPSAMTESVVAMLDPTVASRVHVMSSPGLPTLLGDERLLRIALLNLLENAGKYALGASPIKATLSLRAHGTTPGVSWHIEDHGPGVPPHMVERIFEKYARLGESSGTAGLGLGLYLVRHVVELHGGWVCADINRSEGAGFALWLPLQPNEEGSP